LIHAAGIVILSAVIDRKGNMLQRNLLPIELIDTPRVNQEMSLPKDKPVAVKKPPPASKPKIEKIEPEEPPVRRTAAEQEEPAPPRVTALPKDEPPKPVESKAGLPAGPAPAPVAPPPARIEGGGSKAGGGNLFGKGDVAVLPGSGTAGGGGGTAASGVGRGSGAPGLPAQTALLKTNREAKPVQTVRASYPPMALRMGLEGDVTLRIEIDVGGKVTKAEIVKGAGMGFDDEAMKAVRQSRFEPAERDGRNVPAEFIYIYRFRLQK
jgi:protein TonB